MSIMLDHVSRHPLFLGWDQSAIKALFAESTVSDYESGQYIFKKGELSTHFYMIDEGQVRLQLTSPKGIVRIFKTVGATESFGEAYALMDKAYYFDALVIKPLQCIAIDKEVYFSHLTQYPELMRSLIATLSQRLHHLLGDVLTVSLSSGTQRVMCYLFGDSTIQQGSRLTLDRPKAQIAALLNLTPEHFSRILNDLSSRGFIRVEGRQIELLDEDGLMAYER